MRHRALVLPYLIAFDTLCYVSDLDNADPEWKNTEARAPAAVATATHGNSTLESQWAHDTAWRTTSWQKADVLRAMHERVRLCQDPRIAFALTRESLEVNRVNHILRLHGHTILDEESAAKTFDDIGMGSLERLSSRIHRFKVRSKPRSVQASQGIGCRRSVDVARGTLGRGNCSRTPDQRRMIRDATNAGLVAAPPLLTRLDALVEKCAATFMETLDAGQQMKRGNKSNMGTTARPSVFQLSQSWIELTLLLERMKMRSKSPILA